MRRVIVGALCACLAAQAYARRVEPVTFPSVDRGPNAAVVRLRGLLLLPRSGAPSGGYPAVIAMHGCGGMYSTREGHGQEQQEGAQSLGA